ncbi:MAG TPA: EAL domain-containing protein [Syntrophomonadaceae bacterium]|nr:EAL domain-containing protein [Syntrophomonadaceae bacterium]
MLIKILVVEDSATDRLIIKNMLSEYTVLTACDGVEAMRMLEEHEGINIMIVDLNMPSMDGFQVLEALKKDERYQDVRIIILTNYDELDNEIRGLKLGAIDYIRKPIHMYSLKARIDVHAALLRAEHALKQKLAEQTLSFDMLFDQAPVGISISHNWYPQGSDEAVVRINPMYEQITGRTKEELVKLGWAKITHPDDLEEDLENFRRLQAGEIKDYSMEKRIIKPDGSVVWVSMIVAALSPMGKDQVNHICVLQDISERMQMEMERKYLTEHDRLTGLYNRDYLVSLLDKDIKLKKQCKKALIGIDLSKNHLLTVNYGFQYTQNLIKKTAEAFLQLCADNRLLFHIHENHFVFYIFDYRDRSELATFGKRIAATLESLFVTERIGGGIGIVEFAQDQGDENVDSLLRRLLITTERSGNPVGNEFEIRFYDEEVEALVNWERDVAEALDAVATGNPANDYLYVMYQPIIDLKTGSVWGFEALARLKTDKLGLVPPVKFIPLAEKTKLILPIGEKVLVQVFRFLNRLKEQGYGDINVSVNISAIQLLQPDFPGRLFELMRQMQVNPNNVGIEITESVFASDYEHINIILGELKNAGIHIAIDDFGTGYSSLARERELIVDCVKIDKYFIDKLLDLDPSKAITSDIISMSHKMGHSTVAEGVENETQMQLLKEYSCDRIQGYLISEPLQEEEAIKFLQTYVKM